MTTLWQFAAEMIAVIAENRLFGRLPTSGRIDHNDRLAGVVVDPQIVGDDAVGRSPPAVNGLAAALDDVADDFILVEVEVRFDGGRGGLHVVLIAANVTNSPAKGRMPKQIAAAVGIDGSCALHGNVFNIKGLAGTTLPPGRNSPVCSPYAMTERIVSVMVIPSISTFRTRPWMRTHALMFFTKPLGRALFEALRSMVPLPMIRTFSMEIG